MPVWYAVTTLSGNPPLEQHAVGLLAFGDGSRTRIATLIRWHAAQANVACPAAGSRHRAADAVCRLPRAGRWRRGLCRMLGEIVVHCPALLSAARHSLCLRPRSRPV